MKKHYIAGYYVMKTKPMEWGEYKDKHIFTLSSCINMMVYDNWCLNWDYEYTDDRFNEELKKELGLTAKKIKEIRNWTKTLDCFDTAACLSSLEIAKEFKKLFFNDRDDVQVYSLSLPENDAEKLLSDFAEGNNTTEFNYNNGFLNPRYNLLKKIVDVDKENEIILGHDFIGVDCDGSFHSFHCHNITKEIEEKFSIKLNSHGLFDELKDPDGIRAYLNDPATPVEPLPWYISRVKLIK